MTKLYQMCYNKIGKRENQNKKGEIEMKNNNYYYTKEEATAEMLYLLTDVSGQEEAEALEEIKAMTAEQMVEELNKFYEGTGMVYKIAEKENQNKKGEIEMEAIKEVAMDRVEIWVTKEFNRGWTADEKTGKKLRMKKEDHDNHMAEQDLLITEVKQELEQEQVEVEEITTDLAEVEVLAGDNETTIIDLDIEDGTTDRLKRHIMTAPTPPKLVAINCEDCGRERIIKVQDAFQVKRCKVCQKRYRNKRRNEIRRMKRQLEKEQASQQA